MSKKTLYLLGILLTILIGTWFYSKFCCCCDACDGKEMTATHALSGDYSHFALQNGDFSYQCNDNFRFKRDNFNHLNPVGDSINKGILALKDALIKNPAQKLLITGYCTQDEKNTSAFPNLGFARANDVKNYMVSNGIPAASVDINGVVKDSWQHQGDTMLGPVSYELTDVAKTETATPADDMAALKEKINANPLILYFNTNQSEINLTTEERQKVADIAKYLDKVAEAKVNCVGHTDNVGNRTKNIQLGQDRADFAKAYLTKNGIDGNKINSISKGPDEPIADNGTTEGRVKNRRTVISVE